MLVLSRKSSQEIAFPSLGIIIRVLRTKAHSVKLGVLAPRHLQVLRGELVRIVTPPGDHCCLRSEARRLLVVDDDHNERELLAAVLKLHGFAVTAVSDGVEAIRNLNESSPIPDAILLDLRMPRMSGEETLRCIRADHRFEKIRVIGISGSQPLANVLPDDLPGFDAWFSKPLQLTNLVELLQMPSVLPFRRSR